MNRFFYKFYCKNLNNSTKGKTILNWFKNISYVVPVLTFTISTVIYNTIPRYYKEQNLRNVELLRLLNGLFVFYEIRYIRCSFFNENNKQIGFKQIGVNRIKDENKKTRYRNRDNILKENKNVDYIWLDEKLNLKKAIDFTKYTLDEMKEGKFDVPNNKNTLKLNQDMASYMSCEIEIYTYPILHFIAKIWKYYYNLRDNE